MCVRGKGHSGPKQGLLHPIEKTIPFHTLHLDCTGPFSVSSEGYKHVLIILDGFTKYCLLKPLRTLNGQELVRILRENLTLFGTPTMIVTDRGTNFTSDHVRSLLRDMQINRHMISTGTQWPS